MFTKVFRSIYDGTLADNWQALVTFQQMLILADENGVVDMTPSAMSRTTGIPLEILRAGIEALERPDPCSRTPDMEGRRIARLDEHREWGWFLVNHRKYRALQSREEKREADRVRMAAKRKQQDETGESQEVAESREESQGVASSRVESEEVAKVAYTEADTEKSLLSPDGERVAGKPAPPPCPHDAIVALYHETLPELPRMRSWPDDRQALLRSRWREDERRQNLGWWKRFFEYVRRCPFLLGQESSGHRDPFLADLEWLVRPKNFRKVVEGKYERRQAEAA